MANDPLTVGIVGGMGPEATADLFMKIIRATPATCDQDHLPVVIVSDPSVPDRTQAVLGDGEDPLPTMVRSARACVTAGADFLVMPCNTAHCFYLGLAESVDVPVLHMMEEVARFFETRHPEIRRVGLLATTGTVKIGLYQEALSENGIEVLVPNERDQESVMEGIYGEKGVKCGYYDEPRNLFVSVARRLVDRGADAIISGCTEIPLALSQDDLEDTVVVDPTEVLARAAVARAGKDS
ncbi:MAG: aspartate/glutamate racemase family protein [Clostridia bacterium]